MITSRITSKSQTTLPRPVRAALHVGPGDEVLYVVEGDRVVLTRAPTRTADRAGADDPFAVFSEWSGDADRKAYGDL